MHVALKSEPVRAENMCSLVYNRFQAKQHSLQVDRLEVSAYRRALLRKTYYHALTAFCGIAHPTWGDLDEAQTDGSIRKN
jgi:hypothetical protein